MADNLKEEITRLHANICSGLADPSRILLIYTLAEQACTVNDLARKLDLPQPTVSRHLKILRERGLVKAERNGQSILYSLRDFRIVRALDLLRASMADTIMGQAALAQEVIESIPPSNPIQEQSI
jgi:ArsR family transcriptional regulator